MAKGSDLMLVYGKNVLYEIDRSKIKKAYISRSDYMPYLKENNIKNLFPCHCVSLAAKCEINSHIRINEVGVGLKICM